MGKEIDMPTTTIRENQEKMGQINEKKKDIANWGVFRYPTSLKPVKSVSQLNRKISEYFQQFGYIVTSHTIELKNLMEKEIIEDVKVPTVNGLATHLGYPSASALYREIMRPAVSTDPQYYHSLERAISTIEELYEERMITIGEKAGDFRAYSEVLKRHDEQRTKMVDMEKETMLSVPAHGGLQSVSKSISNDMNARIKALMDKTFASCDAPFVDASEENEDVDQE